MPPKKASKLKDVKVEWEYTEEPVEMTFICPERGKVTETVMVKKYKPQGSPIPVTR